MINIDSSVRIAKQAMLTSEAIFRQCIFANYANSNIQNVRIIVVIFKNRLLEVKTLLCCCFNLSMLVIQFKL